MISKDDHEFITAYDRARDADKQRVFEEIPEQGIKTMLALLSHTSKDHVTEYTLVMLDDIMTRSEKFVKLVHDVAGFNILFIFYENRPRLGCS